MWMPDTLTSNQTVSSVFRCSQVLMDHTACTNWPKDLKPPPFNHPRHHLVSQRSCTRAAASPVWSTGNVFFSLTATLFTEWIPQQREKDTGNKSLPPLIERLVGVFFCPHPSQQKVHSDCFSSLWVNKFMCLKLWRDSRDLSVFLPQ